MSLPFKPGFFSEELYSTKLQQYTNEITFLKQQNELKDEKIKQYENEIKYLRTENASLNQQLLRYEKSINYQRLSSYSKATNDLYDKLSNNQQDSSLQTINKQNSFNESMEEKPKKTFYNGLYFKKAKDPLFPKEEILKNIEAKPIRKNSNNIFDPLLPLEKTNTLFDNFIIISSTRDNFENIVSGRKGLLNENEIKLPPSVIFSYPTLEDHNIQKTIENCVFPFGIKAQQLNLDESFSQLNQIIFASNNIADQRNNCFLLVIKTEESYNKISPHHRQNLFESLRNFLNHFPFNSKDSADAFIKLNQLELSETCNPNNFLYVFGIKNFDFIEAKEQRDKTHKKKRYWSIEKAICFATKYPFSRFFIEAILQISNIVKITKMKLQMEENSESFSKLGIDFIKNFFTVDLTKTLNFINGHSKYLNFDYSIDIKDHTMPFDLHYQIPDLNQSFFTEIDWVSAMALSNLNDSSFSFIFLALLLENHLVFFSENIGLLTSTMMLFLNLIQPFKWHYPIIYNVPQDLMQILESPFPIFVGINRNKQYTQTLIQKYPNILFISLDRDIKIYNANLVRNQINDEIFQKLKVLFNKFSEKFENKHIIVHDLLGGESYDLPIHSNKLISSPTVDQKKISYDFFMGIWDFLFCNIIKLIPEKALYSINEKNLLNYEMIRAQIKNKDRQNVFLEKFVQTQMFTFFLDEYYSK